MTILFKRNPKMLMSVLMISILAVAFITSKANVLTQEIVSTIAGGILTFFIVSSISFVSGE